MFSVEVSDEGRRLKGLSDDCPACEQTDSCTVPYTVLALQVLQLRKQGNELKSKHLEWQVQGSVVWAGTLRTCEVLDSVFSATVMVEAQILCSFLPLHGTFAHQPFRHKLCSDTRNLRPSPLKAYD